jgi:glutamyl-tRNA(Gln) amidotransferase subunit E
VKLVHNEAVRQVRLLALREEMRRRGLRGPEAIGVQALPVLDLLAETGLPWVGRAAQSGSAVYAVKVDGAAGLAEHPTQPGTTFLDELAGRVRVVACLDEAPIVLPAGSLPPCAGRDAVLARLRGRVRAGEQDAVFLVWGPEEDCRTAAEEIRLRFADATQGVPLETRQALAGGHTTFERILPGPDRMYPDTDSPPTAISAERVAAIRGRLRPAPWDRLARYRAWRVPEETGRWLIRHGGAEILDAVVEKTGADGLVAAIEIGQRARALRRAGIPVHRLGAPEWIQLFDLYAGGRLAREAIPAVAARMARDGLGAEAAAAADGLVMLPPEQWQAALGSVSLAAYRAGKTDTPAKRLRFLAGQVMRELRGRAPAREVVAVLRARLQGAA